MSSNKSGICVAFRHALIYNINGGIPQAEAQLRECLALGANEAVLLSDRALAGAETLATSYALAEAIRSLGASDTVHVMLCGKQAIDGDTAQNSLGGGILGGGRSGWCRRGWRHP